MEMIKCKDLPEGAILVGMSDAFQAARNGYQFYDESIHQVVMIPKKEVINDSND